MRSLRTWIPLAVLALSSFSCTKEEPAAPATPPPAPAPAPTPAPPPTPEPAPAPTPTPTTEPAMGGSAAIQGEVKLDGKAPEMQPLKRGVDPVCAKTAMNDEQVLAKDGKLQNVVVWISQGASAGAAPATPAKLEQQACMYRPRVQAVQEGQTLEVHNGDATLHNVRAVRDGKTLFNKAQVAKGAPIVQPLGGGKVVQFKCDVHPWMKGFAVVVPNGFSAVTGEDGKFSIPAVPAGKYTLTAWHELFGTKTAEVTVEADKASPVLFTYSAEDRG